MSTTTITALTIAAFALGILIALAITLVGSQSEETPAARRAALGRVARARTHTPAPRGVWIGKLAVHRDLPVRFSEREGHRRVVRVGRWSLRWRTRGGGPIITHVGYTPGAMGSFSEQATVVARPLPGPEDPILMLCLMCGGDRDSSAQVPSNGKWCACYDDHALHVGVARDLEQQRRDFEVFGVVEWTEQELARRRAQTGGDAA